MPTTLDEIDKTMAMFIAAIVRNAMEDCDGLKRQATANLE